MTADDPHGEPTAADCTAGRRIGRFELLEPLGQGGMGFVFKARDPLRSDPVAVKVVNQLVLSETQRRRFEDEWRALQRISHPNVVRIYEVGVDLGQPFIAMQLVPGPDLSRYVRREGALSPALACRIVSQVAAALDALHAEGLIHRDVKPANVLVDPNQPLLPQCYLADFGLAREVGVSRSLSHTGVLYGTVPYASPEQQLGRRDIDRRSDVFSLGCILYFCLVGAPPFRRPSEDEIRDAILAGDIPTVTGPRPGLAPAIDAVIEQALAVDREQRFPTAGAVAKAAREVFSEASKRPPSSPAVVHPQPSRRQRNPPPWPISASPQGAGQAIVFRRTGQEWRRVQVALLTASVMLLAASVLHAISVPTGVLLMGVLLAAALVLQGFLRTTGSVPVAASPEKTLAQAIATVVAVPGWRIVAGDAASATLESPREVHPFVAAALFLAGVIPGVAYVVHQRTPPRLEVSVAPTPSGCALTLSSRGAEATHRSADIQRAFGILP